MKDTEHHRLYLPSSFHLQAKGYLKNDACRSQAEIGECYKYQASVSEASQPKNPPWRTQHGPEKIPVYYMQCDKPPPSAWHNQN